MKWFNTHYKKLFFPGLLLVVLALIGWSGTEQGGAAPGLLPDISSHCPKKECQITSLPDGLPSEWTVPMPLPEGYGLRIVPTLPGALVRIRIMSDRAGAHEFTVDSSWIWRDADGNDVTTRKYQTERFQIRAEDAASVNTPYTHLVYRTY